MSLSYAQEKAYKVLHSLGSSEGNLQERLEAAITPSFTSLADEAERRTGGLSDGLSAEIVALYGALTSGTPLDAMDEIELTGLAEKMVSRCIETMQTFGADVFWLPSLREE